MKVSLLDARHPTYTPEVWAKYDALYRGGDAVRQQLVHFLPQRPMEPSEVYENRKREAHYTGYVGPIVDWFAAKLLSGSLVARPRLEDEDGAQVKADADPWYASWKEDVDGAGTDLVDFLRSRFASACVKGRSWWCVELPDDDDMPAGNRAEWEQRQLGDARIYPLENEQVLDWEVDERGQLLWAIVHSCETRREDPRRGDRGRVRETWRIYDRQTVELYEISYDPDTEKRPEDAVPTGRRAHGLARVPLVCLGFVSSKGVKVKVGQRQVKVGGGALEGFWLLSRLADPQIAHFRNSAALDWNIKNTCYAMPVFKVGSEENPPKMGAGYYIMIGTDESFEWAGPPVAHLSIVAERCDHLQHEIYRVANQLAQGVDNNAAAIGRSGLSKMADAHSTEVVLRVYGAMVREATEATYDLLAEGRGDAVEWSIEGLDVFSVGDAATTIAAATQAQALGIHSRTARKEIELRAIDALLPNVDQQTKDSIREEVDAGIIAEESMKVEDMMAGPKDETDAEAASGNEVESSAIADVQPTAKLPAEKPSRGPLPRRTKPALPTRRPTPGSLLGGGARRAAA